MKKTYDEAEETNCFKTNCTNEIYSLDANEPRLYNENEVERVAAAAAQQAVNQLMNSFCLMTGMQLDNYNRAPLYTREESEYTMPKNKAKIRRQVQINGENRWISANSEQDYANQLLKFMSPQSVGETPTVKKHLLREFMETWFQSFCFNHHDPEGSTNVNNLRALKLYIYPLLGEKYVEDITSADVQRLINSIGGAKESKKKPLGLLKRMLDYAVDQRIIQSNPAKSSSIKLTGNASRTTTPYTVEQMKYFVTNLHRIQNASDRNWLAIITSNVLRPEEALGFQWDDLDEENQTISVRRAVTHSTRNQPTIKETKTEGSVRTLYISQSVLDQLTRTDGKWIVGGETPLTYTQVRRMCRRIERDIQSPVTITPERFRTTVATDLYEQTGDLKLLQAAGGWTTAAVPLKYYAKGRSTTQAASAAIQAVYGAPISAN